MRKFAAAVGAITLVLSGSLALAPGRSFASVAPEPRVAESDLLARLNDERAAHRLPRLRRTAGLDALARQWSARMAATYERTGTVLAEGDGRADCDTSALCHRPNLGTSIAAVEPGWQSGGENVGTGYDTARLHAAFVRSPGHLANIVGTWDRVGIGLVADDDGRLWASFVFVLGPPPLPRHVH